MLVHEFVAVKREEIINHVEYGILEGRKYVIVSDKIILNNRDFKSAFKTHWWEIGDIHEGLNYHGITLILNEDISEFYAVLEKYKIRRQIKRLRSLCRAAIANGDDIVHFGI